MEDPTPRQMALRLGLLAALCGLSLLIAYSRPDPPAAQSPPRPTSLAGHNPPGSVPAPVAVYVRSSGTESARQMEAQRSQPRELQCPVLPVAGAQLTRPLPPPRSCAAVPTGAPAAPTPYPLGHDGALVAP